MPITMTFRALAGGFGRFGLSLGGRRSGFGGLGFGLGFAVRTSIPSNTSWPLGEYRWDGVAGTFFFIDPKDDMFVILMVQTPSQRGRIQLALKTLIYQALGK